MNITILLFVFHFIESKQEIISFFLYSLIFIFLSIILRKEEKVIYVYVFLFYNQ